MTKKQLEKFIKVRNKSQYNTNFQFQGDAYNCGIDIKKDLGEAKNENGDYVWQTKFGELRESGGILELK